MMNFLWQTTGNALFVGATSAILIFIALHKCNRSNNADLHELNECLQSMNGVLTDFNESLFNARMRLLKLEDRVEELEKDTK